MAETRRDKGHVALTSKFGTTTPVVGSPALLATGGTGPAAAPARVTTGNGYHQRTTASGSHPYSGCTLSGQTSSTRDLSAPISKEVFNKAMNKLNTAVPKRYGGSTRMPTIYKVPDELKGGVGDHKDYRPVVIYLGFCLRTGHDRRECKLEEYKWCCVRSLIDQLHGEDKAREVLLLCMQSMNRLLPKILASYSQHIKVINNDEMVEQMLLDGCLILLLLLKYAPLSDKRRKDGLYWIYSLDYYGMWQSMSRDMLLIENQIPFFVVKELFQLLKIDGESEELLFTGSLKIFDCTGLQMHDLVEIERNTVHHLLHLFYLSVGFPPDGSRPDHNERVSPQDLTQWVPSAKELEEAGVRFRKKTKSTSFLDINFDKRRGILEIPPLELYDSSSALFRNLIAFEQTYPATECDISAYIGFMDCLVNTQADMRILNLRGILVNQMNSEQDASRFFSQLCVEVGIPKNNYLAGLMHEVSKYKDSRWHKWRAALVHNYFRNPWMTMSVFAGMLLLALTFLQTVFTIYPYYKPSKRT